MLESIEATLQDTPFTVKLTGATAPAPVFRVGDVYRFKVGDDLVVETVERINADGVWWRDSLGRRWVGGAGELIPTRAVLKSNGIFKVIDSGLEATGDLFPLTQGKAVSYRYMRQQEFRAARMHELSCTVGPFGAVKTAAGALDAYRIRCFYDGVVRVNYYAPALGRVVLQTLDTIFDSVKRELVSFERGPAPALQTAKDETVTPAPPVTKPSLVAQVVAGRYGVQLAVYRSPARARQAWSRLQRFSSALLGDRTPVIERHDAAGGQLFRLIVGDYATKDKARAFCQSLKRGGIDCWPRARKAVKIPAIAESLPPPINLSIVRR
jgi:hypothetical protein